MLTSRSFSLGTASHAWLTASLVLAAAISLLSFATGTTIIVIVGLLFAPICVGIFMSGFFRLIFFAIPGIFVLQSQSNLLKVLYVSGLFISLVISHFEFSKFVRDHENVVPLLKFRLAGYISIAIAFSTIFVALSNQTSLTSWFRAVLPYLMIGGLPAIGMDAGSKANPIHLRIVFLLVTGIAPLTFFVHWTSARAISSTGSDSSFSGLSSIALCSALFAYALGRAGKGGKFTASWLLLAVYPPISILLTGTRSGFTIFSGIIGMIGPRKFNRWPASHLISIIILGIVLLPQIFAYLGAAVANDPNYYSQRFGSLQEILANSGTQSSDQSLQTRVFQSEMLFRAFMSSPFFGKGPGFNFTELQATDTSLLFPATFGIIGLAVALLLLAAWAHASAYVRAQFGTHAIPNSLRVFTVSLICFLPLGSVPDDKGLAISLGLFAALLVSEALSSSRANLPDLQLTRGQEGT